MKHRSALFLALCSSIGGVTPVLAHGAHIDYQPTESIQIQARYDSGEPMQGAQVMVYSPENLSDPWTQGTTDDQGRFVFAPDPSQPGNWEVTVRQAGHGDIVSIPVQGESTASEAGGTSQTAEASTGNAVPEDSTPQAASYQAGQLSPVQQGITIGAVIWGFIGTALFFARGKR
jgi:nickel transport protein